MPKAGESEAGVYDCTIFEDMCVSLESLLLSLQWEDVWVIFSACDSKSSTIKVTSVPVGWLLQNIGKPRGPCISRFRGAPCPQQVDSMVQNFLAIVLKITKISVFNLKHGPGYH